MLLVRLLLRHLLPVRRGVEEGKPAQDRGLRDAGQRPGLPQERSLRFSVQRPGGKKTQGTSLSVGRMASFKPGLFCNTQRCRWTESTQSLPPPPNCTLPLQSYCYFSEAFSLRQCILIRSCILSCKPQSA